MSILRIEGGVPLYGSLRVHGAKNSVLPILAAAVLVPGVSVIHNCPRLTDVDATLAILRHLGCGITWEGDTVLVDASAPIGADVPDGLMRRMRSSVVFLGPILGRMGQCELTYPGGCELGPRPIDLHLSALRTLGVNVDESFGRLRCSGRLTGTDITLSLPSVGATENAILCATAAEGVTTITNAAREPEIVDLQTFLNASGADIRGAGSSVITIHGGRPLHPGEHTVMGDRIVAATYLAAVAAAGGEGEICGVDWRHLSTVASILSEAGSAVWSEPDRVSIQVSRRLQAVKSVRTSPYPGFPTDAQPVVMAALCRAEGVTLFAENMFENRYRHVSELIRMGADIRVEGRVAVVSGVERLFGAKVAAADLRGGAALAVAGVGAEGVTRISGLAHIERGYTDLAGDLRKLGARARME